MTSEIPISNLKPGDRFRMDGEIGTLIYNTPCRAYVALDPKQPKVVEIQDKRTGKVRTFTPRVERKVSWPLELAVEPIGRQV